MPTCYFVDKQDPEAGYPWHIIHQNGTVLLFGINEEEDTAQSIDRAKQALNAGDRLKRTIQDDLCYGIELRDARGLIALRYHIPTAEERERLIALLESCRF